ncbi:MAG: hypothetical protein JSS49_28995 [Planctomycetes bacterium]|nr:hypothetical protein [Planctomycetota bacterium]
MTMNLPSTLPVFCRARGQTKLELPLDWLHEPKICDAFRESAARDWVRHLVEHWKLDDLPLADLSLLLGISIGQASRLRNHFSASLGVIVLWAARRGEVLPVPSHGQLSTIGLLAALRTTIWLWQNAGGRANRTALPAIKLQENELCLLAALLSAQLTETWDTITERFEKDLFQAGAYPGLASFLRAFQLSYLRVTQQVPGVQSRISVYFPRGALTPTSRWHLCQDIDRMWRSVHSVEGTENLIERMWDTIDVLTPWLAGAAGDHEAA